MVVLMILGMRLEVFIGLLHDLFSTITNTFSLHLLWCEVYYCIQGAYCMEKKVLSDRVLLEKGISSLTSEVITIREDIVGDFMRLDIYDSTGYHNTTSFFEIGVGYPIFLNVVAVMLKLRESGYSNLSLFVDLYGLDHIIDFFCEAFNNSLLKRDKIEESSLDTYEDNRVVIDTLGVFQ